MEHVVLITDLVMNFDKLRVSKCRVGRKPSAARVPLLLLSAGMIIAAGARSVSAAEIQAAATSADSSPAPAAVDRSESDTASKPSSSDSKSDARDAQSLAGRSSEEVEAALGKPTGKLQTAQGALWLYADWRIQFDQQGRALKIEKDQPVRLSKLDPEFVATSDALARAAAARAAADEAELARAAAIRAQKIRIISNGGEQVDLPSILTEGKVTIVDFYAEWCGPCRQMSPQLEQMARTDPDVVLVKIDIVKWGTPVAQQFDLKSIPNVRVFNRSRTQLSEPTHDLDLVLQQVNQAKGS